MAQCDWALWPFPCNDTITQSTSSSSQPLAQISQAHQARIPHPNSEGKHLYHVQSTQLLKLKY